MQSSDAQNEIKEFLVQHPLFASMAQSTIDSLTTTGKFIHVEKGQFIFFQSDPSDKCYFVRSGLISILLDSSDGREMEINEMHPGDFFGELGLVTDQARSASAVVRENSELLDLSRRVFLEVLQKEPLLAQRMLTIVANRLRSSSEREGALAFLGAQARLAHLMMELSRQEKEKGYIVISQEELARRTGMTRQTVAKVLGRWRRRGWMITGRGRIMLLKLDEFSHLEDDLMNG